MNHWIKETFLISETLCVPTAVLVLLVLYLSYIQKQQIEQEPQQGDETETHL